MIKCNWRSQNRILTNVDGQVYPCCYLVNNNFTFDFLGEDELVETGTGTITQTDDQPIMSSYNKSKEDLNIFNKPMGQILEHPWWKELEDSWEDPDKILRQCKKWCTMKEDNNA